MFSLRKIALAGVLAITTCLPVAAAPILGTFDFMGGQAALTSDGIDFLPVGGGSGSFQISNPVCCSFGGLAGTAGTIGDTLTSNGRTPGIALNVNNFIALTGQTWNFILTSITPGTQGFYTLTQVGNSVFAGIEFKGKIVNGVDTTNWIASLTTQYTSTTVALAQASILAGAAPQNSWSGTLTTTPEPGSAVTLFSGLALVGLGWSRRRNA